MSQVDFKVHAGQSTDLWNLMGPHDPDFFFEQEPVFDRDFAFLETPVLWSRI